MQSWKVWYRLRVGQEVWQKEGGRSGGGLSRWVELKRVITEGV
jgi:hypothetical protein